MKIVAKVKVNPGAREEVLASLVKCAKASREEEGNVYYDLAENVKDPNELVVLEEWKSQEAIDFHNSTPHFKELVESTKGKVVITIDVLKEI